VALAPGAVVADVRRLEGGGGGGSGGGGPIEIRGPFLDGFEVPGAVGFEHWKDEWRARLMPRIRDALVKQMDAGRRIGDFAAVERHAQVLLGLDPLCEDAVRGVMEARAWVGDRSNALKAYARFAERLEQELGAKPSADLARVADLLREGRRPAPRPAESGRVMERQERRFEAEPLVGREREFAELYDAWLAVRRGEPRIMVLIGDPGVGKTTLTNAFVSTCQMEGAAVARAQAYDAERELPFAVLAELIKQLTVQRAIGGTDPEALSELTRVSPDILQVFPGVPAPPEWAAEIVPLRLADSFLKAVEAATDEGPLVLVVDDLHAADNASAAILHVVARKLPRTRLLLIVTARANELRTRAGPSAFVWDATIAALRALDLEPLPRAAAERLVAARAGARAAEVPAERIFQAGNGNPLALELLTREWLAHGSGSLLSDLEALNTQPAATIGIPRAIGAMFERQVRRLDPPTRAALDLAAVLGRRLSDLTLYEVVGLTPAAAGEALSRLKDEGLLRDVQGGLEFRNELIRAQAYYAIAGPARQHLHRRVGEELERRAELNGDAQGLHLEIAWHFLRSSNPAKAVAPALAGADAALQVGAPLEAEQILAALLRHEFGPPGVVGRCRLLLAQALVQQSKAEAARQVLNLLEYDLGLSPHDAAEVMRMQASVEYLLNEEPGDHYCQAADRALQGAQVTGDLRLIGSALFEYARSGANWGDEARVAWARSLVREAMSNSRNGAPPILHYAKAYCDFFFYEPQAAAAELDRAIALLEQGHDPVQLALVYNGYGMCMHDLCKFDAGYDAFSKALELYRRIGDDARAAVVASNICALRLHQGNYDSAVWFGELATHHGLQSLSPRVVRVHFNLAMALLMSGRREEGLRCVDEAIRASKGERSWSATLEFLLGYSSVALLTGDKALALDLIQRAEQVASGKERAVPNPSLFDRLRVFRTAHVANTDAALQLAVESANKFRGRSPFGYLGALASLCWVARLSGSGEPDREREDLGLFARLGASGMREILVAQGFLESDSLGGTPDRSNLSKSGAAG
jgi:tetratricopeptide (TPR) repeat protein